MNRNDLEKLTDIQKRIAKFKASKINNEKFNKELNAFNIAIELVSGVIVGVIVGLMVDKLFNTRPIFLLICMFIGILASIRIIWQKFSNKKYDP